jgi:hypothetical protein
MDARDSVFSSEYRMLHFGPHAQTNMSVFQFVIGVLVTSRLTTFIARDYGPFGVFASLRKYDRASKLLKCPFCVSVYCGSLVSLAYYFVGVTLTAIEWTLISLAFSMGAILLDKTFLSDYRSD